MPSSVDRLLAAARAELGDRPRPGDLDRLIAEGALVVDTRPEIHRRTEGDLPGAVVVERNVLEWRLGPDGDHRLPEAGDPGRVVVLVCNDGYASSLAAVSLRRLGLARATDLDGGYRGWAREQAAQPPEPQPEQSEQSEPEGPPEPEEPQEQPGG